MYLHMYVILWRRKYRNMTVERTLRLKVYTVSTDEMHVTDTRFLCCVVI